MGKLNDILDKKMQDPEFGDFGAQWLAYASPVNPVCRQAGTSRATSRLPAHDSGP